MNKLALYYEKTRILYPEKKLIILFDIDGTILDMRYMVYYVLTSYDQNHGTDFFKSLKVSDIRDHEDQVENLLERMNIPQAHSEKILDWYLVHQWSSNAILEAHRPFFGVMEVIRWFQIQPNTYVGLNTGRPESIRAETLRSLNELGKEYKVKFSDELLYMNPYGWGVKVKESKVAGVLHFQNAGYIIFAFIENEPENLETISRIDVQKNILLLHANTMFKSKRRKLPDRAVSGKVYDITELIQERILPQRMQFVWHGVNDTANLRQFFASDVRWAELDVRLDPHRDNLILRHDSFEKTPVLEDEDFLLFDDVIELVRKSGKSLKLDLKEGNILLDKTIESLKVHTFDDSHLWFNGKVEILEKEGFRKLSKEFPLAIIQCPIDFLVPLIVSVPEKAKDILTIFREWGINRFSVSWKTPNLQKLLDKLDTWGFEVNLYNVPDLESFLKAVLLLPKSITSDFNFPKWHYYGRGSGQDRKHYQYSLRRFHQSP